MTKVKTLLSGQRPKHRKRSFSLSMTHYNQKSACFTSQYFFCIYFPCFLSSMNVWKREYTTSDEEKFKNVNRFTGFPYFTHGQYRM